MEAATAGDHVGIVDNLASPEQNRTEVRRFAVPDVTRQADVAEGPDALRTEDLDHLPIAKIPIASLLDADSPRIYGEDLAHTRVLADTDDLLPPIVVQLQTMRVIDGMHRLRAARLRGEKEINARIFDGDEASSFVLAVRMNVAHGLPLSASDRKAAASRILDFYPHWSDRMIASVAGLAASTVAAMRPTTRKNQLDGRVGRDGKFRPLNSGERREIASKLIADNPTASLRQIAEKAGISPETVRDVRTRLRDGEGPASRKADVNGGTIEPDETSYTPPDQPARATNSRDGTSSLRSLMADPALRYTENGRSLLRMLSAHKAIRQHKDRLIASIPGHCMRRTADAARACAAQWQELADSIEERVAEPQ
jgi:ParB-like chromosome segregation protein Spo0J